MCIRIIRHSSISGTRSLGPLRLGLLALREKSGRLAREHLGGARELRQRRGAVREPAAVLSAAILALENARNSFESCLQDKRLPTERC